MPADVTASDTTLNKVLATMALTTTPKQYDLDGKTTGRSVVFYCDVAWRYSHAAIGPFIDVPAHPAGFEVVCKTGITSIFARTVAGVGTLTPTVSR